MSRRDRPAVHGNGSVRARLTLSAGLLAPVLALVLAAPGTARAADSGHMTHPNLDWLGSQIKIHEGADAAGDSKAVVTTKVTQTPGMDVSSYQGDVNWPGAWSGGAKFAYVKATEGTSYTNPYFAQQYNGSYKAGMIRGSYHFALPDLSGGAAQADYFVAHGGGWSADGKTLPGALDMEYNPYGASCYGKSASGMVSWIQSFSNEYHAKTGRYPTIYTSTSWWSTCTGNSSAFAAKNALWIARYSSSVGTLPAGWKYQTFWQWADTGAFPGDQDRFNGALDRVKAYAKG
jgi:GH25 family lysozyme M1 (1,4-beta-N-acetylmuramidase)